MVHWASPPLTPDWYLSSRGGRAPSMFKSGLYTHTHFSKMWSQVGRDSWSHFGIFMDIFPLWKEKKKRLTLLRNTPGDTSQGLELEAGIKEESGRVSKAMMQGDGESGENIQRNLQHFMLFSYLILCAVPGFRMPFWSLHSYLLSKWNSPPLIHQVKEEGITTMFTQCFEEAECISQFFLCNKQSQSLRGLQ